jgi:hypothetical protein
MRAGILISLLIASAVCSQRMFQGTEGLKYEPLVDHFGREYSMAVSNGEAHTVINARRHDIFWTPEGQTANIKRLTQSIKEGIKKPRTDSEIEECSPSHPDYFKIFAKVVASLTPANPEVKTSSYCYKTTDFKFELQTKDTITVSIYSVNKNHLTCGDGYLVSTGKQFHFVETLLPGLNRFTFTGMTKEELEYVSMRGVEFMRYCDSAIHMVPDLILTAQMFLGGLGLNPNIPFAGSHVPMEQQKANVDFIKEATGFQWKSRTPTYIDYDASNIRSGDFFAITRFDGLDNIIQYGAGSHSGHSVMALWDRTQNPAQLYIVESQDAWYWPTHGLQRTKWADWKKQAHDADFNVAHLPLRDQYANAFDENKAWAWFNESAGMPYGYRNFVFGWIDTIKDNYPAIFDIDYVYTVFRLIEQINAEAADILFQEALNWRTGTTGLKMWQIELEAQKQGMELGNCSR